MQNKPGRLQFGLVGSGKVGTVLAKALAGAGHEIVAATCGSPESAERLEALLPGVRVLPADEVVRASQLVLFALPAAELEPLVAGLAQTEVFSPGQLLVHTAPEFGYSVFAPAQKAGVIPVAITPALVFTGTSIDLFRLRESVMVASAPAVALPIAQALIVEMGAEPVVLAETARAEYADALQAAQQMSKAIVQNTVDAFNRCGVETSAKLAKSIIGSALSEALRVLEPVDLDAEFSAYVADF